MENTPNNTSPILLALVGMPGSGKTEAAEYLQKKGIPVIRFGTVTDEGLRSRGLPITPENESMYREKLRHELGMAAYAIKAKPKIDILLQKEPVLILDGLYSWEEYTLLKKEYPFLRIVHIYARPHVRYERIATRANRPFTSEEVRVRDVAEIEKLNKGGPIAMADYLIENNRTREVFHEKLDVLLEEVKKG